MSFSFGFTGDDIEDDGPNEDQAGLVNEMLKHSISEPAAPTPQTIEPSIHTLRELVSFYSLLRGHDKAILVCEEGCVRPIDAVATRHRRRCQFWGLFRPSDP